MAVCLLASGAAAGAVKVLETEDLQPSGASEPASTVVASGDDLLVHITLYDETGRLLYSTDGKHLEEMNRTRDAFDGPYLVPFDDPTKYSPARLAGTNLSKPVPIADGAHLLIGSALEGHRPGASVFVPVMGRSQGYTEELTLDRMRGPFNRTMSVDNAWLDNLPKGDDGVTFVIDDVLTGRVAERGSNRSTVQIQVADGDVLSVRKAGFQARAIVDEAADQFSFHLEAAAGDTFTLDAACRLSSYVLPVGSYRVLGVDDAQLQLVRSPTKLPQLIGREMFASLTIVEILGPTGPGGEK